MNLYEILGLRRDASTAEIRKAHREAVKQHHPDHGGSAEKFSEAQRAYAVLSDPDRRARYDQTGEEDDQPRSSEEQMAAAMVAAAIAQFISGEDDLSQTDIVAVSGKRLAERRSAHQKTCRQIDARLDRVSTIRERLRHSDGGGGDLADLLAERERELGRARAREEQQIRVVDRALATLAEYSYRIDPPLGSDPEILRALKNLSRGTA